MEAFQAAGGAEGYGTRFVFRDHLGSPSVIANGSGVTISKELYLPYGDVRYQWRNGSIATQTQYRYTGQRMEAGVAAPSPAGGLDRGLSYYGARWYDASLARFISADTIVPEPGNPQALNRYSYTLNNPIRYTDPSGHAPQNPGDPDDMPGDCATQWCWENRWYRAHGYVWNGSGNGRWIIGGNAHFYDQGVLNDTIGEAGISFYANDWDWNTHQAQMIAIGQGIVRFGQRLGNGLAQLGALLGGSTTIKQGSLFGHPNALPPGTHTVHMPYTNDVTYNQQTVVHELAHIIDWNSEMELTRADPLGRGERFYGPFSAAWHGAPLTNYAACTFFGDGCINPWERWAEAVTVWVFGGAYERQNRTSITAAEIRKQMTRVDQLLNGWR